LLLPYAERTRESRLQDNPLRHRKRKPTHARLLQQKNNTTTIHNRDKSSKKSRLEFAKKLQLDIPEINILAATPGVDIWDELKTNGTLDEDEYWETGVLIPEISPNAVPLEEINRMIHEHLRHFLLRPSFMMEEILKTFKSTYRLNLLINNLTRVGTILENARFFA